MLNWSPRPFQPAPVLTEGIPQQLRENPQLVMLFIKIRCSQMDLRQQESVFSPGQKHLVPLNATVLWKWYSWNSKKKKKIKYLCSEQFQPNPKVQQWMPKKPNSTFHNNLCWWRKSPITHRFQLFPCHFFLPCSSRQPVNHPPFEQEPRACSYMRNIPATAKDSLCLVIMQPQYVVSQDSISIQLSHCVWLVFRYDWCRICCPSHTRVCVVLNP